MKNGPGCWEHFVSVRRTPPSETDYVHEACLFPTPGGEPLWRVSRRAREFRPKTNSQTLTKMSHLRTRDFLEAALLYSARTAEQGGVIELASHTGGRRAASFGSSFFRSTPVAHDELNFATVL
jgi:hypothetical protein